MNYDFTLKNRGYLKIEGPLSGTDTSVELEKLLLQSLEKCHALELNIDDITAISPPCLKVLRHVGDMAKQKKQSLLLSTRYQRETMTQWIINISDKKKEYLDRIEN